MTDKQIIYENYYKELFKAFYNKRFKNVKEVRQLAESLGYDIENDPFESLVHNYLNKKRNLNDYDKTRYLKVLLYLSEIYNINLREMLKDSQVEIIQEEKNTESILDNLSNTSTLS